MDFLEKNLEDIIMENDNSNLEVRGLHISGKKFRQLNIRGYGVADIVTYQRIQRSPECNGQKDLYENEKPSIVVYELKKNKVSVSAFIQAVGYLKGIQRYLEYRNRCLSDYHFGITLIGSQIDLNSNVVFLSDVIDGEFGTGGLTVDLYTYKYGLNGIIFKLHHGYTSLNENFECGISWRASK